MIKSKLDSRQRYVKATVLKNRAQSSTFSRRGENHVYMGDEDSELDKFDTFFDFEEDIAELKPSGEQYSEMINSEPFVTMESKLDEDEPNSEPIELEEEPSPSPIEMFESEESSNLISNKTQEETTKNKKYNDVVGFKFVQCEFEKSDGNRCKRQAPKGASICSTHKRYLEKHG